METKVNISQAIESELLSWPNLTAGHHRFGGRAFSVGSIEIGHLHGSRVADLPFPRAICDELIAAGKALPHHHLPDSAWVTIHLRDEADIPAVLALFRQNYERILVLAQHPVQLELSQTHHAAIHGGGN